MSFSVVMITRNCGEVLAGALESIEGLWDELLVSDQNSTDGTRKILEQNKATIFETKSANLGKRKQDMVRQAKGDWILVLDSDERVSPELYAEIKRVDKKYKAYQIPYQNYVFGKRVYWGGERYSKVRLFRRGYGKIDQVPLHEDVIVDGTIGDLHGVMYHHSFRTPAQLFSKFTSYALIAAKLKKTKGENVTLSKLSLYGPHMFWSRYVNDRGYRDSWRGLVLAAAFGYMEWLTYVRLIIVHIGILAIFLIFHIIILHFSTFIVWEDMIEMPWLLSHHLVLYRDILLMYPPGGLYLLVLLYRIFGYSFLSLQLIGYLLIVATDIALYVAAVRIFKSLFVLIMTLVFYIIWHPLLEGKMLWFETLYTPFFILLFIDAYDWVVHNNKTRAMWAGLWFGISVMIKQSAGSILIPFLIFSRFRKNGGRFLIIPLCIGVLGILWLAANHTLSSGFDWMVTIPLTVHTTKFGLRPSREQLMLILPLILSVAAVGLVDKKRKELFLILAFIIGGAAGAYPRWAPFHLLPALPFIAIAFGLIVEGRPKWAGYGIAILITVLSVQQLKHFYNETNKVRIAFDEAKKRSVRQSLEHVIGDKELFNVESGYAVYFLLGRVPSVLPWPVTSLPAQREVVGHQIVVTLERQNTPYIVYWGMPSDPTKRTHGMTSEFFQYLLNSYTRVPLSVSDVALFERNERL